MAEVASAQTDVPLSVVKAISLIETARKEQGQLRAWPWTVSMQGESVWFTSPQDAKTYAHRHFKVGVRSFDVGCFEFSYKWHHQHFSSIDEMLAPKQNALYAARFLSKLFREFGDWMLAAGVFHSQTPALAKEYKQHFFRNDARVLAQGPASANDPSPTSSQSPTAGLRYQPPTPARGNTYQLLRDSDAGTPLGSLVPQNANAAWRGIIFVSRKRFW
ncbi:lytic transglycosylase domain-containing protein [Aliiroseovarius sp. N1F302]|uniref:lytic transglycosylase domain-containing protein n=1 Tax=Aliiroseovarius sediminis TaxID=2925839 RepID=UPI001F57B90C|nr:lytic transglycosylase domain-containing protein [Aliiroseovarius sediminis]MCI2395300.1 lytic transglycosylase domain-containing protein [Aliiroseovarius sediminis]